jgi:hypothetical protein
MRAADIALRHSRIRRPSFKHVFVALTLLGLLGGCEKGAGWSPDQPSATLGESAGSQAPSAQAKASAAALSISGGTAREYASEYARAIECASATDLLLSTIGDNPLLGEAEIQGIRSAARLFETRAYRLADQENSTRDRTKAELRETRTKLTEDTSETAMIALACIRTLAEGATTG